MIDFNGNDRDAIAVALAEIALEAGPAVMEEYRPTCLARAKADGSPVTAADERAEAIIAGRLQALAPDLAVVAEEATAAGAKHAIGRRFFLVDPLDGTREFMAGNGEFTINVALVEDGQPIAGAVYAPARSHLWFGGRNAFKARAEPGERLANRELWEKVRTRGAPAKLVALASRSHADPQTEAFLSRLDIAECVSAGSSIKFCVVAEGSADVYPRFAPTMEWDTAAGDAILRAAGGCVLQIDGAALAYGKEAMSFRTKALCVGAIFAAPRHSLRLCKPRSLKVPSAAP